MLTIEKVKLYNRWRGDIDSWARSGSRKSKSGMEDDDWYLIDRFIGDLTLIKNGHAAESYTKDLNDRLLESCDSQETINQIKKLVEQPTGADKENKSHSESMFKKLLGLFKRKNGTN